MRAAFTVTNPRSAALRALNYSPAVEAFRCKASLLKSRALGDLVLDGVLTYGGMVKTIDCAPEFGVEYLSQADMFSAEPHGRIVRRDLLPDSDRKIRKWQVLIAGAGTLGQAELYGRCIVADARLEGRFACSDALALTFKESNSDESLYSYAFLCTHAGIQCLRSASYGTKILRFRPDLLRNLPIPYASDSVTKRVADLVRKCVESREIYQVEMNLARRVVENLPEYGDALDMCNERIARTLVWRGELATLGAWNYASTGGALEYLQQRWSGRLRDVIEPDGLFNGLRFARVPCSPPHGLDLLSQRDVFMIRPVSRRIKHPGMDDKMLLVPDHALLLASHGQLTEGSLFGRAESAACCGSNRAFTQDILRIIPQRQHSEMLLAFLSTKLGLSLLRSTAVGTSVPTMHIGLLRRLPVPNLGKTTEQEVRTHISAAISGRASANNAEAEAVRIVEEEVLPKWLN
jgi:hypothetical protein